MLRPLTRVVSIGSEFFRPFVPLITSVPVVPCYYIARITMVRGTVRCFIRDPRLKPRATNKKPRPGLHPMEGTRQKDVCIDRALRPGLIMPPLLMDLVQ